MRVLAAGAGCITLILGAGRGIPLWLRWRTAVRARTAVLDMKFARDVRLVQQRQAVRAAIDRETTRFLGLASAFFKGGSAPQGASALAGLVADAAQRNGVDLSSLQPEADSAARLLVVPVSVRVAGSGDMRGIAGMLRDLEGGTPLVSVRDLTIGQSDPSAPDDRMESLHLELTVRGLYRATPGEEPSDISP